MKIAIASGKGGTGKTTVAVNFAYLLSQKYKNVSIIDCDVEEPNCHLFLKPNIYASETVYTLIPEIDHNKCIQCSRCAQICEYNALAFIKKKVLTFPELCHSCASCMYICPVQAISEQKKEIGIIEQGFAEALKFVHGIMKVGQPMAPPLIKAVKQSLQNSSIQIIDSPPGTSCSLVTTVNNVDFVFLVTEPSPFALHDLKIAVEVMKKLHIPFGVIINKSGETDFLIENFSKTDNINILTKIPDKRSIAETCSQGKLIVKDNDHYLSSFQPLINLVRDNLHVWGNS